jgi:hypothetical protein
MLIPGKKKKETRCDGSGASAAFPGLITARLFPVSETKSVMKRERFGEPRESCKSDDSTDRGIEKWFPGMLPKVLQRLAKACHCPRILLWE